MGSTGLCFPDRGDGPLFLLDLDDFDDLGAIVPSVLIPPAAASSIAAVVSLICVMLSSGSATFFLMAYASGGSFRFVFFDLGVTGFSGFLSKGTTDNVPSAFILVRLVEYIFCNTSANQYVSLVTPLPLR